MKKVIYGVIGFILLTWIGGFIVAPEKNPELVYKGVIVSDQTDKIIKESCFDCHSNETAWPWYTNVPPMSLLVNFDVAEGREHLNFSEWESISEKDRAEAIEESLEEIEEGEMPIPPYLIMHSNAKIDDSEMAILKADMNAAIGKVDGEMDEHSGEDDDHDHDEH